MENTNQTVTNPRIKWRNLKIWLAYKCAFCDGNHVGKNRDNKTDYDKQ